MKRKILKQLKEVSLATLKNEFNIHFDTTHLSNELLDMLSDRRARKFIIDKFFHEFSHHSINVIFELDY